MALTPRVTLPKTLADGRKSLILVTSLADPKAPTVAEIGAGIDMSCRVLKNPFTLGAADSDTVDDQAALCESSNSTVYGASNFTADITVFRWFSESNPGQHDATGDAVFQALKEKGTEAWLILRESGKPFDAAYEAGDEVEVYRVLTDNPQPPSDAGGYIRRRIPMGVQEGHLDAVVAD